MAILIFFTWKSPNIILQPQRNNRFYAKLGFKIRADR